MAVDSYGARRQPQFLGSGAPDDAADLTTVAQYAADYGNYMADTSAVRQALPANMKWPGLLFFETDTGRTYLWYDLGSGADWINPPMRVAQFTTLAGGVPDGGPYAPGTVTAVPAKTINGGFVTLASNKLTLEPGSYSITWTLRMNVSQPTAARTGYVQIDFGEGEPIRSEYGPGGDTGAASGIMTLLQPTTLTPTFYKQGGGTPNVSGTIRIRKDA
jgi:hypothetical protein